MKIPKTINIKGQKFKIKEQPISLEYAGLCDRQNKIIYINSLSEEKSSLFKLEVFAHELTHAFIGEKHISHVLPIEVEELICLTVEEIVMTLLPVILYNKKEFEK